MPFFGSLGLLAVNGVDRSSHFVVMLEMMFYEMIL